jgi:hypothetical protein
MAKPLYKILRTDTPMQIRNKIYFAGETQVDGTLFSYELFLLPVIHSDSAEIDSIHEYLIKKIGTRQKDGKTCLDVTEDVVRENIDNGDYSVIGFVKNVSDPQWSDEASGTMQYYDWCKKRKGPQMWINDLCRITESVSAPHEEKKPTVSPLKALLILFEQLSVKCLGTKLKYLHLLVEDIEPERTVLPRIYNKYGFTEVHLHECKFEDHIVMKKTITESALNTIKASIATQSIPSLADVNMTSIRSSPIPIETIHNVSPQLSPYRTPSAGDSDRLHSIFEFPESMTMVASSRATATPSHHTVKGYGLNKRSLKKYKYSNRKHNKGRKLGSKKESKKRKITRNRNRHLQ